MLNTVAIDTITNRMSISARGTNGLFTTILEEGGQHAPHLLNALSSTITLAGFDAKDIQLTAIPQGPGSFTGLRLAWATAKSLQLSASCPLVAISPLLCYAYPFREWEGPVIAAIDAKKGRFYFQVFRNGEEASGIMDEAAESALPHLGGERLALVTGPDSDLFSRSLHAVHPEVRLYAIPEPQTPLSRQLILFAESGEERYTSIITDDAGPLYVRKSDAETEYNAR